MEKVICLILGGGKGTGLYPLTKERAKAAVPFGGKYRMIDIALSNCINSGLKNIYVLTQFNTPSLLAHILENYRFDSFTRGFVNVLSSEFSLQSSAYEGSADAARKAIEHLSIHDPEHFIIIHGDLLFRMDLQKLLDHHRGSRADVTMAVQPVTREKAGEMTAVSLDVQGRVLKMKEKAADTLDKSFRMGQALHPDQRDWEAGKTWPISMGIYAFKAEVLRSFLSTPKSDFTRDLLPEVIRQRNVETYIFTGYGENIGSVKSFYHAQMNLTSVNPAFNLYDDIMPIFSKRSVLPLSKINFSTISQALVADGCIITNSTLANSIIGERTVIDSGSSLDGVIMMGADYFESLSQKETNRAEGIPHLGIGRGTTIKKAIIDKNARIGDGCRIGVDPFFRADWDNGNYFIKDGILVIPKGAVIPSGTVI